MNNVNSSISYKQSSSGAVAPDYLSVVRLVAHSLLWESSGRSEFDPYEQVVGWVPNGM